MASTRRRRDQQQRSRSVSTSSRKTRESFHRSISSTLPASNRGLEKSKEQTPRGTFESPVINVNDANLQVESTKPPKSPKPYRARGSRGRGGRKKKTQKATASEIAVSSCEDAPQDSVKTESGATVHSEKSKALGLLLRHEQVQTEVSVKETVGYDYNSLPGLQRSRTFSSEHTVSSVSTCGSARITHVRDNSEDLKGLAILDDRSPILDEISPNMIEGEMFTTHSEMSRSRTSSYSSSYEGRSPSSSYVCSNFRNTHYEVNRSRTSSYSSSYEGQSPSSSSMSSNLRSETTLLGMPVTSILAPSSNYNVLPPMLHGAQQYESRFLSTSEFPKENHHGSVYGFDEAVAIADLHPLRISSSSESEHLPPRQHHRQRSFTDPSHDMEEKWMHEQRQIQHNNTALHEYEGVSTSTLCTHVDAFVQPGCSGETNRARTMSDPRGIKNLGRNELESIRKQREVMPDGGSLFNISPTSFLMGKNSFDFVDV